MFTIHDEFFVQVHSKDLQPFWLLNFCFGLPNPCHFENQDQPSVIRISILNLKLLLLLTGTENMF